MAAAPAPASPRRWGEVRRRRGVLIPPVCRRPPSEPRGALVQGIPGGGFVGFGRGPVSGEPKLRERRAQARRLVPTQRFALERRSPRWAALGAGTMHRIAAVGPGGCCGSPGTTERRQGPPRACTRSSQARRKSGRPNVRVRVQRRRRRARAWQQVPAAGPLTPLALRAFRASTRRARRLLRRGALRAPDLRRHGGPEDGCCP